MMGGYPGYPNLYASFGWSEGVYDVRGHGWKHPWIVVMKSWTVGAWTRAEAREIWRNRDNE